MSLAGSTTEAPTTHELPTRAAAAPPSHRSIARPLYGVDARTLVDRLRAVKLPRRRSALGAVIALAACSDDSINGTTGADGGARCEGLCGCALAGPPDLTRAGAG